MAILDYADPQKLSGRYLEIYEELPTKPRLNIGKMWANAPHLYVPGQPLVHAILHDGKLEQDLRELMILTIARIEGGLYVFVQHIAWALRVGCSQVKIAAIEKGEFRSGLFSEREAMALRVAEEVVREVRASEATMLAAKALFTDLELVEMIFTTGFYMMMIRLSESTRVDLDPPVGIEVPKNFNRLT